MPDTAKTLEGVFQNRIAKALAEREAQEAADSILTDDIAVLRERAERHAYESVDAYSGHFDDTQSALDRTVITPLLDAISRIVAERDAARTEAAELERALGLNEAAAS